MLCRSDLADVVTQRNGVADIVRIGRIRGEEQRDVADRKEGGQDIGDRLLRRLRIDEGGIAAEDQAVGWRNRRLELDTAVDYVAAVYGDDGLQRLVEQVAVAVNALPPVRRAAGEVLGLLVGGGAAGSADLDPFGHSVQPRGSDAQAGLPQAADAL